MLWYFIFLIFKTYVIIIYVYFKQIENIHKYKEYMYIHKFNNKK